ncbi:MAG TPA: hypothetical protein DDW49_02890 [Deltaproteobacteria bacterium]|nr:MAG: hypothetical protein A2048_10125 [Deltaproteobacteria bacterium GWA2_45_12]HBF12326.1 hypothetical protein [Deltaproteobacteria bacterium]
MMGASDPPGDHRAQVGSLTVSEGGSGSAVIVDEDLTRDLPPISLGTTITIGRVTYVVTSRIESDPTSDVYSLLATNAIKGPIIEGDFLYLRILKQGQILTPSEVPHKPIARNAYIVSKLTVQIGRSCLLNETIYTVEKILGDGASANVYLLRDEQGKPICLKLFKAGWEHVFRESLPLLEGVTGVVKRQFVAHNAYLMEYVTGWYFGDHYRYDSMKPLGNPQGLRPLFQHPSKRIGYARTAMRMYEELAEKGYRMEDMKYNTYLITDDGRFVNLDVDGTKKIEGHEDEFYKTVRARIFHSLCLIWGTESGVWRNGPTLRAPRKWDSVEIRFVRNAESIARDPDPILEITPEYREFSQRALALFRKKYAFLIPNEDKAKPTPTVQETLALIEAYKRYLTELEEMATRRLDRTSAIAEVLEANERAHAFYQGRKSIHDAKGLNIARVVFEDFGDLKLVDAVENLLFEGRAKAVLKDTQWSNDQKLEVLHEFMGLLGLMAKLLNIKPLDAMPPRLGATLLWLHTRGSDDKVELSLDLARKVLDGYAWSDESKFFLFYYLTRKDEFLEKYIPEEGRNIAYPWHFTPLGPEGLEHIPPEQSEYYSLLNEKTEAALFKFFNGDRYEKVHDVKEGKFIYPREDSFWLEMILVAYVYYGEVPDYTPDILSSIFIPMLDIDIESRLERVRRFLYDYLIIRAEIMRRDGYEV